MYFFSKFFSKLRSLFRNFQNSRFFSSLSKFSKVLKSIFFSEIFSEISKFSKCPSLKFRNSQNCLNSKSGMSFFRNSKFSRNLDLFFQISFNFQNFLKSFRIPFHRWIFFLWNFDFSNFPRCEKIKDSKLETFRIVSSTHREQKL